MSYLLALAASAISIRRRIASARGLSRNTMLVWLARILI